MGSHVDDRAGSRPPGYGRASRTLVAAGCVLAAATSVAAAQTVEDLARLSIEELAAIEVTSVSRRAQPLSETAAAIYVITAEDIRRSGAGSLPEVLRLAPNLQVARLNAYNYAITARGFNSPEAANKLLVLVDGRTVYSPFAGTVFWESVAVPLPDVERIEVISGPGGTLWGANAVNGVINIITRHSSESQGVLVDAGAGNAERKATVRYGGSIGDDATFRVYASRFDRSDTEPALPGDTVQDAFRGSQAGFRMDLGYGDDAYTLQGDIYRNYTEFLAQTLRGGNVLGRWTRQLGPDSAFELQAYYDTKIRDYAVAYDSLKTFDVQAQHGLVFGDGHRFVWGGEYRVWRSLFESQVAFGFQEPEATLSVGSAFAQAEFALGPDLRLTLGSKVEVDSHTGANVLPNLRLAWQVDDAHMLWSAVSRAVRTPSRIDRELSGGAILVPAPDFRVEKLTAYEIGYRGQPTARSTLSVSAYYNVYDDLRTLGSTNGGLPLQLRNDMGGETYGIEAWGTYSVRDWWRLRAGFDWMRKDLDLEPGTADLSGRQAAGQDPRHQAQLRSEMDLGNGWWLDLALRRVGRVPPTRVPAYTEVDAHLGWQVTPALNLSLHGVNLLDETHVEVNNPATSPSRRIGRTIHAKLRAEF